MKHLALFVILFVLGLPVLAQDATVEANPVSIVTAEAPGSTTVEDGGTVINIEAPVETPVTPVEQKSFLSSILEFAIGALVGAGIMLGSAAAWIRAAMQDPVKMTLAETASRSMSPEMLKQVLDFLDTSRAFVVEATDGVPMITKQPTSASSTGGNFESAASRLP